MNQEMHLDLVL